LIEDGKVLVMDVDGTLCPTRRSDQAYAELEADRAMVDRLRWYRGQGWYVILQTSRNMRTHQGNVGRINATTLPELVDWLRRYEVPHDELHVGKPWTGHEGFYVDDRAIRPAEFLELDPDQVTERIARDNVCDGSS
jgi:capsule biosynthesis phosphatase